MFLFKVLAVFTLLLTCDAEKQKRRSESGITVYSSIEEGVGDFSWTNQIGASCPTGTKAQCNVLSYGISEHFEAKGFNFGIPLDSNITSILVTWSVSVNLEFTPRFREVSASIFKDGGGGSQSEKWATPVIQYASTEGWNNTVGTLSYPIAGEDALWETEWNASAINSDDFGASIRTENPAGIDIKGWIHCIEIEVQYLVSNIDSTTSSTTTSTSSTTSSTTTTTSSTTTSSTTSTSSTTTSSTTTTTSSSSSTSTSTLTASSSIQIIETTHNTTSSSSSSPKIETTTTNYATESNTTIVSTAISGYSSIFNSDSITQKETTLPEDTIDFDVTISPDSSEVRLAYVVGLIIAGACGVFVAILSCILVSMRLRKRPPIVLEELGSIDLEHSRRSSSTYLAASVVKDIVIQEHLGGGRFGDVYKGLWNDTTEVACKRLKEDDETDVINESIMLVKLNHPHVVRFYGIYSDNENAVKYMIMEYLPLGSLDKFLKDKKDKDILNTQNLILMASSIAAGMSYLEDQKIVHRDLGARNLLVSHDAEKYSIKIADLGMGREIEADIYDSSDSTQFPVKWSAPEVTDYGQYSSKSDIWSFGIVLWELFSFGAIPYPGLSNSQTIDWIKAGHRMQCPKGCPEEMYDVMLECWNSEPLKRPRFKNLYKRVVGIEKNNREKTVYNNLDAVFGPAPEIPSPPSPPNSQSSKISISFYNNADERMIDIDLD